MANLQKIRLAHGKHPCVLKNRRLLRTLEQQIEQLDPRARIIPGRFKHRRGNNLKIDIIRNEHNHSEIFIKILDHKIFQRFKVECSSEIIAGRILLELQP